jgi:hypothetical protein
VRAASPAYYQAAGFLSGFHKEVRRSLKISAPLGLHIFLDSRRRPETSRALAR